MSRMKALHKPPLAKSPTRLRPRRIPLPNSIQTPPGGSLTKSLKPNRAWDVEESEIRPEYMTISCELRALAKKVREELGDGESAGLKAGIYASARAANTSPLFERGRFYEEYSARRNERLKRKKGYQKGEEGNAKTAYNLGVTVESAKRGSSRKIGSVRKSISAAVSASASVGETPRYMLRSMSKENNKPPLPLYVDKSVTRRLKKAQY